MSFHLRQGVRFSLLLHGILFSFIVFAGAILPDVTPPVIIDFSIATDCGCPSCNCSEKPAESARELAIPKPPVRKAHPASYQKPLEKKDEAVKLKEPSPTPLKSEIHNPVSKRIVALQAKHRFVVEEKNAASAVKQLSKRSAAQNQQEKSEVSKEEVAGPSMANHLEQEPSAPDKLHPSVARKEPGLQSPSNFLKERYMKVNFSSLRDTVQRNISYPSIARRMGWEGKVIVAFIVCDDGRVEDVRVIKSCGFKALDNNAVKTIKSCAPFPRPPVKAEVTLPITYNLN